MYKLKRISMFILNKVETSHILISIRLYFILTILITEDGPQPSILSDCNFSSSAGEGSGTQGLWEGGLSRYIGTGSGEPRKGTWISFYLDFFIFFLYFQLKSTIFREVSVCPRGPKAVLFRLAKFLLEALVQSVGKSLLFVMAQLVRHLVTSLLESSNDKSMSAWYASYIEAT
jgi:hypothetical protein